MLRIGLFAVILLAQDFQPPLEPDTFRLRIKAAGDIMMGSTYPTPILPEKPESLFSDVQHILSDADITIGNLEGTILDGGMTLKRSSKYTYAFRMPKHYANLLKDAGFDLLSVANNHVNDFGLYGLNTTMAMLDMVGIGYSGPKGKIARLVINGVKVIFVAFCFSPNCYSIHDIPAAQREVAALKRDSTIVIVAMHGGAEGTRALRTRNEDELYLGEARGNLVAFAHSVIDSGADLVIGHGPHVPRAFELYRERLIAYSLGNFCTYGRFNLNGACGLSLILDAQLDFRGRFVVGRIWPVYQEKPGIPMRDSLSRSIALIKLLSQQDFGRSAPAIGPDGTIHAGWGE